MSTGKSRSSGTAIATGRKPVVKLANRNTISVRPFNHKQMTKAEMQEDLRKAVENTK